MRRNNAICVCVYLAIWTFGHDKTNDDVTIGHIFDDIYYYYYCKFCAISPPPSPHHLDK